MIVGNLGAIPFVVARGYVRTFDGYSRTSQARWATHELVGAKPIMEFLGPGLEKVQFKMLFRADLGMSPEREARKLRELRDSGEAMVLIIGGRPIGNNKWTVESVNESVTYWDALGRALSISVDVTLNEYVERAVI